MYAYINGASKETYHFFRATPTKIHAIKINNIWTEIGFPGQFQTFSNQFNVSSNQFRAKYDRGKESEFKFVFGHSKSTTQRSNYNLRQPIWHNEQRYSSIVMQIRPFVTFPCLRSFKFVNPIKPKLFWGLPGPRGGGHIVPPPPPEFLYL